MNRLANSDPSQEPQSLENPGSLPKEMLEILGGAVVSSLRADCDLSYLQCVNAATTVMDDLIIYMGENHVLIDISLLKRLQAETVSCQSNMSRTGAKKTLDYANLVAIIDQLQAYRTGSENREMMWPGAETKHDNSCDPARLVSTLCTGFQKINPRILYEVIAYPGDQHPDEFKLLDVLTDEIHWLLQKYEASQLVFELECLDNLCDLLISSMSVHPGAARILSANESLRGCLFRIMEKTAKDSSQLGSGVLKVLKKSMLVMTAVLSTLTETTDFQEQLSGGRCMDDVFPECTGCLQNLVLHIRKSRLLDNSGVMDQLIALIVVFGMLHLRVSGERDLSAFFGVIMATAPATEEEDFVQLLPYTVIKWWNHHGIGSSVDGSHIEKDVGLHNAVTLIEQFLFALLPVKTRQTRKIGKISEYEFSSAFEEAKEIESFAVISDSDALHISDICSRIMRDCDPDDYIFQKAKLLEEGVAHRLNA